MKTKPILIVAALAFVIGCGIFITACKTAKKTKKAAIIAFLKHFDANIKAGKTKAALTCFEDGQNKAANKKLIKLLAGKSGPDSKGKALFKVDLDIDAVGIDFTNPQAVVAVIPAKFKHDSLPDAASHINFTLHKVAGETYKIVGVKADDFASDYALYQNKVINATVPETDLYSPETLAAFKVAKQLQTKYDSVLWFQHVDKKAWYFVIKGKITDNYYWEYRDEYANEKTKKSDFKMGLVNPDLKEVIPVEYDLVHNIGGTIDSLIEVEKGGKKGFYDMAGKLVVPVSYDMVLPLSDGDNIGLLNSGSDFFYLKKDLTLSEKIVDFKIAEVLPKVKHYNEDYTLSDKTTRNLMEYNSRDRFTSLVVSPSYLVEWNILDKFINLQNPLRKFVEDESGEGEGSGSIAVSYDGTGNKEEGSWFESIFHSVVDDYLGSRASLYQTKNVLVIDKKQNKVFSFQGTNYFGGGEGGGTISGTCNENSLKAINDSLFEFKTTSIFSQELLDTNTYMNEAPYYYYLQIKGGKLVPLATARKFPTQFVKLDDSYLRGCYMVTKYNSKSGKSIDATFDRLTPEILQVMKNEIYASYNYKFKNERWNDIFRYKFNQQDTVMHDNVDDSLTVVDKYNIEWINSKLKIKKAATLALR
ncbi:YARHG domain-containing protein [Mucilaginibacter psychrotolerans]|uniref:YARHG domain-containing protein n=1 Tax=Mucilaginibacter psychrotolerans TaxID=1524096 RepID=A0A4Y8SPP8_9SPHI|nr:YARHG domain-containing protein [Mucilaginibacter psychrotolerans]TFF40384.1 YARHG domain-containing protein [Mucilaginibacter psychrotolerans]